VTNDRHEEEWAIAFSSSWSQLFGLILRFTSWSELGGKKTKTESYTKKAVVGVEFVMVALCRIYDAIRLKKGQTMAG
jgi:hypothetical protein